MAPKRTGRHGAKDRAAPVAPEDRATSTAMVSAHQCRP